MSVQPPEKEDKEAPLVRVNYEKQKYLVEGTFAQHFFLFQGLEDGRTD